LDRPLDRRVQKQRRHRIQFVRVNGESQPDSLERNAATACCRIENLCTRRDRSFAKPSAIFFVGCIAESARISISGSSESLLCSICYGDTFPRRNRIAVDAKDLFEFIVVSAFRQDRPEDCSPRGNQRAPCPPDMETVRCGKWVIGVRSRTLSIPNSVIGSQRSINLVSDAINPPRKVP